MLTDLIACAKLRHLDLTAATQNWTVTQHSQAWEAQAVAQLREHAPDRTCAVLCMHTRSSGQACTVMKSDMTVQLNTNMR